MILIHKFANTSSEGVTSRQATAETIIRQNPRTNQLFDMWYNPKDLEQFNFHTGVVLDALKLKNEAEFKSFQQLFAKQFGYKYTTDILTAALFNLAEIEPDICRWALKTFSALNLQIDITEGVVMFAVKKLIKKGFICGQDFSVTATGGIVINKNAQAALREGTSASDWLFIEEILQIGE